MARIEEDLAGKAERLRRAHHENGPVLLPNAWDAASARAVEAAGFPFVATSSRAVAAVLGETDDDSSDPDLVFSFAARIAGAVKAPVTADLQGGFRLEPGELVSRILDAGLVGCNLEDTLHHDEHRRGGPLVGAERQAGYLREVRAAADRAGVHVVLNARTDSFILEVGDQKAQLDEAIRRGRLYLEAGADCVYPIAVRDPGAVAELVEQVPGPLNFLAMRGGLSIRELTELGARRISLASGVFRLVSEHLGDVLSALSSGVGLDDL